MICVSVGRLPCAPPISAYRGRLTPSGAKRRSTSARFGAEAFRLPAVNDRQSKAPRFLATAFSVQIASHSQAFAPYLGAGPNNQRWQCVAFGANANRRGNEPVALGT